MRVRLLSEDDVRAIASPALALEYVRAAFVALAGGRARSPAPLGLEIPEQFGELHVKGGYVTDTPFFSVKVSSAFSHNPLRGLPASSGMSLVFDAETGLLEAIVLDNGYLTDLRTGAAGALAAQLLAPSTLGVAAVIGAGLQARYQLEALIEVRRPERVLVWARNADQASAFAARMSDRLDLRVDIALSARSAVEAAELVVTVTSTRIPIVRASWLHPGLHITAVGADMPSKQELEHEVLAQADKVVVDSIAQASTNGELHHALAARLMSVSDVHAELGEIAAGLKDGRSTNSEVTVADLTGLGIQDAAVAGLVADRARSAQLGRLIDI